ncbi:hypothetical protein LXL04_013331 [Taraxacum kok-saghyz]
METSRERDNREIKKEFRVIKREEEKDKTRHRGSEQQQPEIEPSLSVTLRLSLLSPALYMTRWSKGEQSAALATVTDSTLQELYELNSQYKQKFGFVFLICASGRSTPEILAELKIFFLQMDMKRILKISKLTFLNFASVFSCRLPQVMILKLESMKKLYLHNPYILTLPEVGDGKDEIVPKNINKHVSGTKSYARLAHEEHLKTLVYPTRGQIYVKAHTRKVGKSVPDKVNQVMASLLSIASDSTQTSSSSTDPTTVDPFDYSNDDYSKDARLPAVKASSSATDPTTVGQMKSLLGFMGSIINNLAPNPELSAILKSMNIQMPNTSTGSTSTVKQRSSSESDQMQGLETAFSVSVCMSYF